MIAAACAVALLVVHNVVIERLAWWMYVPACLTTAAGLVALGAAAGLTVADMGLYVRSPGAGLLAGPAVPVGVIVVTVIVVVAAVVPTTRQLFADRRMAGVGPAGTAYRTAVRIPLGTVLLEEVAFRGVLIALLAAIVPLGWAVAATCVLFGLWHLVPTTAALDVNGIAIARARDRAAVLAVTVGAMAVAGALLCWLRLATGSIAAPAVVHVSATATATAAAYAVQRTTPPGVDEVGGRHDPLHRRRRADPPSRPTPPPSDPPSGVPER